MKFGTYLILRGAYIRRRLISGTNFVLVRRGAYIRGAYIRDFTVLEKTNQESHMHLKRAWFQMKLRKIKPYNYRNSCKNREVY